MIVAKLLACALLAFIAFAVLRVREPEFRAGCVITQLGGPSQGFPDDVLCTVFYGGPGD
jgi:hypothetical protein